MFRHSALALFSVLILALVLPGTSLAGKKKQKVLQLQPLADEVTGKTEFTDDMHKVLRYADRCLKGDLQWDRGMNNEVPVNQLYEILASAVTCWQTAEKKGSKLGETFGPATLWFTARARYVESFRSYIWAIDAKLSGESAQVCRRLTEATRQAGVTNEVATGLADRYSVETAKALALGLDQQAQALGRTIAGEFEVQRCR